MKKVIKKAVSFILVFLTVFSVFSILPGEVFHAAYVSAAETLSSALGADTSETYTTDDFTYILTDEYSKVQIVSYIGSGTEVVIPDRIDNKKVTSIGSRAFYKMPITSVVIGQYVETIGDYAFFSCQSLAEVDFSRCLVSKLGNYSFAMTKSLESVEFPDSLTEIGNYAFSPYSNGYGGSYATYAESSLKSIKFGKELQSIGTGVFYYNKKLASVDFTGESLTSIGTNAFSYCTALTELNLANNSTDICSSAFYGDTALKTVNLGTGVRSIGNSAFKNCTGIETVSLPESLTVINQYAFEKCTSLQSVVIPNGVETLAESAFLNCTALKTVSIGSGCKSISEKAFVGCTALEEISVSEDSQSFSSVDGVLFNKDRTSIILYPKSRQGEYVIPDTVTSVAQYSFYGCNNLTGITVGANTETVGDYAFRDCGSLAKVIFKNSENAQKAIGNYAFYNCPSLSVVDFGNAVASIGNYSFALSKSIESIEFPDSLESIGDYAFTTYTGGTSGTYKENNLGSVRFGKGLLTIGYGAFFNNRKLESAEFTGNSLTSIGTYAFYNCYALAELSLTGNDAVIGNNAFYNNTSLKTVNLVSGVKTIGGSAFRGCSNLESVSLPDSLTSIDNYAFYECKKLESVAIPNGVASLGNYVFSNCSALKTVSIGSGCNTISGTAFVESTAIEEITVAEDNASFSSVDGALLNKEKTSIVLYPKSRQGEFVIPDTVTSIAAYAFDNCPNLTAVTIGANVSTVGEYAFRNCASLTKVIFKNSDEVQKTIGNYSFYNCSVLEQADLGNAVVSIGNYAFYGCQSLSQLNLGNALKTIGGYSFALCNSLESIEFPDSLTEIGNYAFSTYSGGTSGSYAGSSIKSVRFGSGINKIGTGAFYRNKYLETVEFTGDNLTSIGQTAFYDCIRLTELSFSGNDAVIGSYAFYNNTLLKTVNISGVKSIENNAFRACSFLETVNLPDTLTKISSGVFNSCNRLKSITIPNGVTALYDEVFMDCMALKTVSIGSGCNTISKIAFVGSTGIENISVSEDNQSFSSVDGVLFNKDKTSIILYPKSREGEFVIPDTVTSIASYAFSDCTKLTKITVGANTATVGEYAFRNCSSLETAVFKNSDDVQKTIGNYAFHNCPALSAVDFGNAVASIGNYSFALSRKLESIEFPDSLKSIGDYAFTTYTGGTSGTYKESILKSVSFGNGLLTIGNGAFYYNRKLESAEFTGNSLTSIGSNAFNNCQALAALSLTGNDAVIGGNAFYNCTSLKNVSLGSGIKKIDSNAFRYCSALEEVTVGNDTEQIGNYAFGNCTALNKMVLGKGLTSIQNNAISGYSKLTVYCYEDTYAHTFASDMSNVEIKLLRDNYYVTDLKASAVSSRSVTLTWKKPNGYDSMDHYIIFKNGIKYDETTDTSYTDINLTGGKEYVYGVVAVDSDNIASEEKTVSVIPACTSVKSITLPNNNTSIGGLKKIKLTASMENNLSKSGGSGEFLFSSDGEVWKSACPASVQSGGVDYVGYWSLENVISGEYTLRFLFTDKDGGESFKDIKVNVDRTHPAPIDEVTITPKETYIALSWQISVEYDTDIYRIYRKADGESDFELISEIRNRNVTSYSDKNVKENVTYYYYIVGTDSYGQESLKYDVVSAGLISDTVPPQFIRLTPPSNSYIYGNTQFYVSATDNVGLTKTELYYSADSEAPFESWTLLDEHNGSSYSENVDTKAMPNGVVFIAAKLYDAAGNYTYSPKQRYMCDNQGPEQIKNVKCIAVDGTTATLSWDNVSDDDIAYFMVECRQADGTWVNAARTSTSLGVNLSGLTPENEYTFRVAGYDKRSNRGVPSEEIVVSTLKDTIAPKVTKLLPEPGYFKSSIPLKFTVEDDYRVESIRIETSADKADWTQVAELTADSISPNYTFEYKLDLADYEEGSLFVRAFACDSYGNVTDKKDLTCYEYVVDRTAPVKPSGVTADSGETEGGSSFVRISWDAVTNDNSFAYYRVYKSESADGVFSLIKDRLKTVNTYDEDVEFSSTYYYKVECVDLAGNVGEQSQAVSCKVKDDTEAPVIHEISPSDGARIGANNNLISVAASDNAKLSNLKIEYKTNSLFSSYSVLKEITGNSKNSCTAEVLLPVAGIGSGTEVTVKVTAGDSSGNEAEEKTVTYIVDKDAPEIKDVVLSDKDGKAFNLSWTAEADDITHFYIYRKRANDSAYQLYASVTAESGKTSYSYSDNDISASDKSVSYKIEAVDLSGNTDSVETEAKDIPGSVSPIPLLKCQSTVVMGSEYLYDASNSVDDKEVVSYSFDFGDGTELRTNESGKVLHIYNKAGNYTLVLTVLDSDGNAAVTKKEITVTSRELVGSVTVVVKDDSGNLLPNTDVYMDLGEDCQQQMTTDSSGVAVFELPVGTHTVASYKADHLPVKQNISVTSSESVVSLVLVNEPIVTGEFDIHKMTFDEIVAAGIDINAAENRNVVKINVTLMYEQVPVRSVIYWNGHTAKADPVYVKSATGEDRKLTPYVIGGSSGGNSKNQEPTVVYLDVPVEFSYLKDFFSVSLHIINHASSDFSLLDNTVKLNVPDGLSIVNTNSSESKETVFIKEIAGQTQKTVKWVLRGDKPGAYNLTADFFGMLSYFNEPISATFYAKDPIMVQDASSISVEIEAASKSYRGKIFYNITVKNNGNSAIEGFAWKNLTESFADEYVDASGNSYEMEKQRTTLKPGEKFVYHCFEKVSGNYKYIDNIIDDSDSFGAKTSVKEYDVSHFLDLYFDKYPEESGAFVFYVKDTDGNPVKDASVKLSPSVSLTTDKDGKAVIEYEDRANTECSYLMVTAAGFYDYSDEDFAGVLYGSSAEIKLHRKGEFSVEEVLVDGKDALSSVVSITTNDKNSDGSTASVTFISKIYGEVSDVDIVQKNKKLAAKSKTADSDEYLYTNTYPASAFAAEEPVYLNVTLKSGEVKEIALNINSVEVDYDISLVLPEKGTLFFSDCSIEWLNGLSFDLEFEDNPKLSVVYNRAEGTVTCGVNIEIAPDDSEDIEDIVDADSFREGLNAGKGKSSLKFSIQGALEFKVKSDGSLVLAKSRLFLGVAVGYEYTTNFVLVYVPLTMTVGFELEMSAETSVVYNSEDKLLKLDEADLSISVGTEIQAGVGVSCLSAGIYGSAELEFLMDIMKSFEMKKVELSGEIGLYIKLLFFTEKLPIISGETTIYERDKAKQNNLYSNLLKSVYDGNSYSINTELLNYNSGWTNEISSADGITTLIDNAYSAVKSQIAVCGDKTVMVYQSVDSNAENAANALALYYSVYDKNTGKWSVPSKLDDNSCADMSYSLAVCDNQAYIVYTQSNSECSDDITLNDAVKNIDVYSAKFNFDTNRFESFSRISENETYDASPVLKSINGVPTAVWMNSSSNNPFFSDDSNSIMTSSLINGTWTKAQAVAENINTVLNCDLIESSRNKYIVYTADKDGDLSTTNDKVIYLYDDSTGSTVTVAENVETAVTTGEILDKAVVMWYENGSLMQYDVAVKAKTQLCSASGSLAQGAKIVKDGYGNCSIVYVEDRSSICALCYNTESGKWSQPITLVTSDNCIENVEAEYINGKLTLTYYDTSVVDENMNTESKLVTTATDTNPKPIITNAVIDYSKLEEGREASVDVTVTNNSAEPTGNLKFTVKNYNGDLLGTFTAEDKSLSAGESGKLTVPFTAPEKIVNRCITVTVTDSTGAYSSSYDINLGYTDMKVDCEQYINGKESFIKATVYNRFSYQSPATLEVYNRFTNEVYYTENISDVSKASPVTKTIPLDSSYIDESGFVSVRVKSKAADYYESNNSDMFEFFDVEALNNRVLIGDVNGDGTIKVVDATLTQKLIAGIIDNGEINAEAADVNRDGRVNITDVTAIQKYIAEYTEGCGYCGVYLNAVK